MGQSKTLSIRQFLTVFLVIVLSSIPVAAQQKTSLTDTIPLKHGAHRTGARTDVDMERWRNYGLGQFIHWGIYAIPGGKWEGKTYNGAAEWIRSWSDKTAPKNWSSTYDNLYKQFNPKSFDASAWAKQAKTMGAKYMIFTTKHHDGFCLWPSKFTPYTVKNTPYKKDIVKQVVNAYNKEGIDVYLYFSIIDWNHPGYRSATPKTAKDSTAYLSFLQFTRNQLLELLKEYPTVKGFWFDGTWDKAWIDQTSFTDALERELRKTHPGLIIGSRFRADDFGKRHFDSNNKLMGDYEQGWERKLPTNIDVVKGRDWDAVMTIPPNQWGYNEDWKSSYIKSSYDLSKMLMQAVSLNGNLVINFGPDGDGNIRTEESQVASELGKWVQKNSEAIYGVRYADLPKPDYGYYTQKGKLLYLTVFNVPVNKVLRLTIPKKHSQQPLKAKLGTLNLTIKQVDMGLDKDENIYYDIALPNNLEWIEPFSIRIDLDKKNIQKTAFGDAKT
jgi:alpha-L-fucosidase